MWDLIVSVPDHCLSFNLLFLIKSLFGFDITTFLILTVSLNLYHLRFSSEISQLDIQVQYYLLLYTLPLPSARKQFRLKITFSNSYELPLNEYNLYPGLSYRL